MRRKTNNHNLIKLAIFSVLLITLTSSVLAEDVAYIIKTPAGLDQALINEIHSNGLTIEVILENEVQSTDFSQFPLLIVGDERLSDPHHIPIHEHRTLVLNSYNYYQIIFDKQLGLSRSKGSKTSPTPLQKQIVASSIGDSLPSTFNAYRISDPQTKTYYLSGQKPIGTDIIITTTTSSTDAVIATFSPGTTLLNGLTSQERIAFFGITEAIYWTSETRQLFSDVLSWLQFGVDFDDDGFLSENDCDDSDPTVHPGAVEIPYDGRDQDCDGEDLNDVDNDGFLAEVVGGLDCNDEHPGVNPNNPNPLLNCINDSPVLLQEIPDQEWNEDSTNTLNLLEYFSDPDSILEYHSEGNQNILITFQNDIATFTPNQDWFGTETIEIHAEDEEHHLDSNTFTIEILNKEEPPQFGLIECETFVLEDTTYTCTLSATDEENDEITFSTESETLSCNIEGNELTYISEANYNGIASCLLKATDNDGSSEYILEVEVFPVNDPPIITAISPEDSLIKIPANHDFPFTIETNDPDQDTLSIEWLLDNNLEAEDTNSLTVNKEEGLYQLKALISDGEFSSTNIWNIIVNAPSKFTCEELNGSVCSTNQACTQETLGVKDTNACCFATCEVVPQLTEINTCTNKNSDIVLEIVDPDEPTIGEQLKVEVKVTNNNPSEQDLDIELHLYNLDDDESVAEAEANFILQRNRQRIIKMDLGDLSENLDTDDKYELIIVAKDSICNQEKLSLDLERPDDLVTIERFEFDSTAQCGEQIKAEVKVENKGSQSQEAIVEIESPRLNIELKSTEFSLEDAGNDEDKETIDFILTIPRDAKSGDYSLKATTSYEDESDSETKKLRVICDAETKDEEQVVIEETLPPKPLQLNPEQVGENQEKEEIQTKTPSWVFITTIVLLLVTAAMLYFFYKE